MHSNAFIIIHNSRRSRISSNSYSLLKLLNLQTSLNTVDIIYKYKLQFYNEVV